jgi:DNA-binding response OmpR family regulator
MRVLIADDEPISRRLLEAALQREAVEVVAVADGEAAWAALQEPGAPRLAILDWMMPGLDGVEVVRRLRARGDAPYVYTILLTSKDSKEDLVSGLNAGADDYLVKPFHPAELGSRLRAGQRIVELQSALGAKVEELQEALAHVKTLQGLLPICMHCKRIRDDGDTWHRMETYISAHSGAMFSHSLCEECLHKHYPAQAEKVIGK